MREEDLDESSQRTISPLEDSTITPRYIKQQSNCHESLLSLFGLLLSPVGMCAPCSNYRPYVIVKEGYSAIHIRFGKVYRIVNAGLYFINRVTDEVHVVNMKLQSIDINDQTTMTKDNIALDISSTIYWKVFDLLTVKFCITDVKEALIKYSMSTISNTIAKGSFKTFMESKESIIREMQADISAMAITWGITIDSMVINNVKCSEEVKQTLFLTTKEQKIGESRITAAKVEVETAKLIKEASELRNRGTINEMIINI